MTQVFLISGTRNLLKFKKEREVTQLTLHIELQQAREEVRKATGQQVQLVNQDCLTPGHQARDRRLRDPRVPRAVLVHFSLTDGHCSPHSFVVLSQAPGGWKLGRQGLPRDKVFL